MRLIGAICAVNDLFVGFAGKQDHEAQQDEWEKYKQEWK
jgi:hypothetical protein